MAAVSAASSLESLNSELVTSGAMIEAVKPVARATHEEPFLPPYQLPLKIRDLSKGTEIFANTRKPFVVDNDVCAGRAFVKVRTDPIDPFYAPYFTGKKRMFEVMIEGKLKELATGDRVYIGIETNSKIHVSGFWANMAASVIMKLISVTTPSAHVGMGSDQLPGHVVFPLDAAVDRLCVTPPDGTPPSMGVEIYPEQYAKGHRPKQVDYNTEDTYSFSLHSMYVDLVNWKLVHLPGIGSVSLDTFLRGQALRFVGYTIPADYTGAHTHDVKRYLFNFEIDNVRRKK